jgi:DNA-binding transcriptional MerR regulator
MIDLVRKQNADEYVGVKELSDAAERLLRAVGPSQERGTVAEYPNERTTRYYLSEGLISPPYEKRGLTSVFGYPHLLTLLVVKKLQAKGLTISIIRTLIAGKSVEELENLLDEDITVFTDRRSLEEYRRRTGVAEKVEEINDADGRSEYIETRKSKPAANEARSYLETLLIKQPTSAEADIAFSVGPVDMSVSIPAPSAAEPNTVRESSSWQRHEITPGLELNVSENFDRAAGRKQKRELLKKIRQILGI